MHDGNIISNVIISIIYAFEVNRYFWADTYFKIFKFSTFT